MKIGFVASQFGGIFRGGAEVQFENTVKAIQSLGIACEYITAETRSIFDLDLVHFFKTDEAYLMLSSHLDAIRKPYVVSSIFYPESAGQRFFYDTVGRLSRLPGSRALTASKKVQLLRNAAAIYPNTTSEAAFVSSLAPGVRCEVVPNCAEDIYHQSRHIDESAFRSAFPQVHGERFVLNVGRIEPRKNQYRLILACKKADVPLVIIGKIRDPEYWRKCLDVGHQKLYYLGEMSDKAMLIAAYKACYCFALPSTMETPGLTAIEAALQGTRILITQEGGTRDYFKDEAVYVDPGSQPSIDAGLAEILQPQRRHSGFDFSNLSYGVVAQTYIEEYERICTAARA